MDIKYTVTRDCGFTFINKASFCIGTGRMGLTLQRAYYEQLKLVQEDIHFSYIRGHGLFSDDMAIYQTFTENGEEKIEYNFTYLDMVIDSYLSLGIMPFLELGFMPKRLASGEQTIFYWKGNVTPPKDYMKWAELIKATLRHMISRYGKEEVLLWPVEVWNEPNLTVFWKDADMQEYFKLYEISSIAVKEVDPSIRVGGPAICGVDDKRWLREFLTHCSRNKLPLDFVTRHAYATEAPERIGHYDYQLLRDHRIFLDELKVSRDIIDSFPEYRDMEMHVTEFNTSYTPKNPIHDTNLNAAYLARCLSEMGDTCASYSYWTFGDIFEEQGVAFTPFSGCFGLVANGFIRKPTFWTFSFFNRLKGRGLARTDYFILTKEIDGTIKGVAWNPIEDIREEADLNLMIDIPVDNGSYVLITSLVDEVCSNPLKTWLDLGSPCNPSAEQLELISSCSYPKTTTRRESIAGGVINLNLKLSRNALLYFEIRAITQETDRGFIPERIQGACTN